MALDNQKQFNSPLANSSNLIVAAVVMMIIGIMILPMPTFLMDVFLVMNITGALVILFVSMYVTKPLQFSVFPSVLLIITLFRLSLNVGTTRLILGSGYAGEIIESFGSFVAGGNYVVGIVIFLVLVLINFVVITKGAGRIAEVSARFTLDAMPGKQMAIDADLNAGLIDDVEAKERREIISQEASFHGAMDGASKFVRGDAVAGLIMTGINIVGGLLIGVVQMGMTFSTAAQKFTLLTIGDGLVAQLPALIISTAAGIIVTRAAGNSDFGEDIKSQIANQPRAVIVSSGVLGILGLVPGLPFLPFAIMATVVAISGFLSKNALEKKLELDIEDNEEEELIDEEKIESFLHPDPFEIEIGYGLIPLVDANQGGNLLDRISTIRKSLAIELGMLIPPIRIRDNIQLDSKKYIFKIHGVEIVSGDVMIDYYMVLNPGEDSNITGVDTIEPTFGLPAKWCTEEQKEIAEASGYTTVEPPAVIATHLMEVLRTHAHKLLDRQETQKILDHLKETHSAVVEGLIPDILPLGTVNQVLKNLLKEGIPIRNIVIILETLADNAAITKDPDILTEYVRMALAATITESFKNDNNEVFVSTLDPSLEDHISNLMKEGSLSQQNLGFAPNQVEKLFKSISDNIGDMVGNGAKPTLLVSPQIRKQLKRFVEPVMPELSVLSYSELNPDTNLRSVGSVQYPN